MFSFWRKTKQRDEENADYAEQERLIRELDLEDYWRDVPQEQRLHPFVLRKQEYDAWVEEQRLERTGGKPPTYQPEGAKGVKTVRVDGQQGAGSRDGRPPTYNEAGDKK